ncbi:MAG: Npt1/Npt2 family nucleotide transporter [Myxococcaceae bacterium]
MATVLGRLFPVRRGERQLSVALFFHGLFATGAFVAGRSARDALFMSHIGANRLAEMYVLSASSVALVGLLYAPLATRFRRDRIAAWTSLLFATGFVFAWLLERGGAPWVYPALYVFVEVMGALSLLQFWTLVNELFHAREAKRLYGFIGAGGLLSNVLVGLLTSAIATAHGTGTLLLLCTLLLVASAIVSRTAARWGRERLFSRTAPASRVPPPHVAFQRVMSSRPLRAIAVLTALTFLTTTLVDFQFKVITANAYPKDALAAFYGRFYAIVGLIAVPLQLFATGPLLSRLGVAGALALLPLGLALGNLSVAIVPLVATAVIGKGADTLFRYSINDATTQLLYLPTSPNARASAKALIDGFVKAGAIAVAGGALTLFRYYAGPGALRPLAIAGVLACGLWLAWLARLRSTYVQSLQDNLKRRSLVGAEANYALEPQVTGRVLLQALDSSDAREVRHALELLPRLASTKFDDRVERLLDHTDAAIRTAALHYYGQRRVLRYANSVFRKFDDSDVTARAAAVNAFCDIGGGKSVRNVLPLLQDGAPEVRCAAIVGVMRYGGLEGIVAGAEALQALLHDANPSLRAAAARVLGEIGVRNFHHSLLDLLSDSNRTVRREATHAAGLLRATELISPLLERTRDKDTATEAIEALASYGHAVAPQMAQALANRLEDIQVRRAAARVLGRMESLEAGTLLSAQLSEPDEELRLRLYRALSRVARRGRLPAEERRHIEAAIREELERAYLTLAAAEGLGLTASPGPPSRTNDAQAAAWLLASSLNEKVSRVEQRVFLLLAALHPGAGLEHVWSGLHDARRLDATRRRATATELLDNVVDRPLRQRLLPLVEDNSRAQKLAACQDWLKLSPRPRSEWLASLCRDEAAWVRSCALYFATLTDPEAAEEWVALATTDSHVVVRETAVTALPRTLRERAKEAAKSHLTDDSPLVRRQAERIVRS